MYSIEKDIENHFTTHLRNSYAHLEALDFNAKVLDSIQKELELELDNMRRSRLITYYRVIDRYNSDETLDKEWLIQVSWAIRKGPFYRITQFMDGSTRVIRLPPIKECTYSGEVKKKSKLTEGILF